MDLFELKNEIAVVIGGTGVLGGAIAEGLAQAGAKVVILGRNAKNGKARASKISDQKGHALYIQTDATQKESLHQAHLKIQETWGCPTILVNAVGGNDPKVTVTPESPFEKIKLQDWGTHFNLNLIAGALLPCQEFGAAMIKHKRGSIINIASVSAHIPLSRVVAYSAAKAAVLNLTRFLAREWATSGVRVNSITPGFFPADQNRRLLFQKDGTPTVRTQSILAHTPMNRFGEAHELLGAVIFLASHRASSFVTGADIPVDGGFMCQTI